LTGQVGAQLSLDLKKTLSGYPELSRLELEKSRLLRELAERDIVRSVTQDYYRLYILLGKRADYSEARAYFSSHIKDIEKLESAGLDLKLDRVRAEIQLKSLELTARELESDISSVLKSLSSAAGKELKAEDLVFEGGLGALDRLPGIEAGFIAVSTCAGHCADAGRLSSRLDRLETSSAFETYRQSKFSYAPTLQLGLVRSVHIIDPATELYRTYIAVNLDVFDFGAHSAERTALLRDYEARRETELENQKQLRLSLDRLTDEMAGAAASYTGLKKNYEAAAGNLETAKLYYTKGKIKETDLLSIFSEYLDAKQQSRDALGRYLDKKAELAYLRSGGGK
jgi:outer membrane protein TolC